MRTYLRNIAVYKPGKPIEELKRELGIRDVVKLASNENPFPPSPRVRKAVCQAVSGINRYPEGNQYYLRQRIAREFGVSEDQIIFGNGSDEIIVFAVRSLVAPGQEIVTSFPTFLIYKIAGLVEGIRVREVPAKGMRYDLGAISSAITDSTKLVFIANPDNPTGTYVTKEELARFLNSVPEDVCVFLDEAYYEFAKELEDYPNGLDFLKAGRNVVVSRTFSKYYGLAGIRLGYAFARKEIIDLMNRVREPFNVNSLAQVAGISALDSKEYYDRIYRLFKREKGFLRKALIDLGLEVPDSATNFLLVKIGSNTDELVEYLLKSGIIVRHMKAWGLEEYIRVTVGQPRENRRFIKAMKVFLKKKRR